MSKKLSPLISSLIRSQSFTPNYTACSAEGYARFFDAEGYIYSCAIALGNKSAAIGEYYPEWVSYKTGFINRNIESVSECKNCMVVIVL